jgi:aminopeptidase YwaD
MSIDERDFVHGISAQEAFNTIEAISTKPRYVGSDGDQIAIDYIANKFKEYGLQVEYDEFEALAYEPVETVFEIKKPFEKTVTAGTMFFAPATEGIQGELVFVGNGDKDDYDGKDVTGKIALIETRATASKGALWHDVNRAGQKGAIGIIFVHYEPRLQILMLETGCYGEEKRFMEMENPIPAISIPVDEWLEVVREAAGAPIEGYIKVDAVQEIRPTCNVRGIIKGTEQPEKKVMMVAHRDGVSCPASNDNGSGQAVIVELARVMAQLEPKRTIEFVSLGAGEVLGCYGAWRYVELHKADLPNIEAVINLDAIGFGGHLRIVTEGSWLDYGPLETSKMLNEAIRQAADDLNYHISSTPCPLGAADATPFLANGVPASWLWRFDDPYWHTPMDIPMFVDPNSLKYTAEITGLALLRLANK